MQLQAEGCNATFDPCDGGRLASFVVSGRELLVQDGVDAFHWGNFVIAPWVGRLRDGRMHFAGTDYHFPLNGAPHALHGLVTGRPWRVVTEGTMAIELTDPWPWPARIVQSAVLTEGQFSFEIRLESDEPMPAAVGWHPWFVRRLSAPDGSTVDIELDVEPGLMWANDPTGLPSGELTKPAQRPWDHCFRQLSAPPAVRWPGILELTVDSSCSEWVLYDKDRSGICIEPWSGPPNSLNMANPTIVSPGSPLIETMTWTWHSL